VKAEQSLQENNLMTSSTLKQHSVDKKIAAKKRLAIMDAAESLHDFFRQAWPSMEGNTPFIDGWHIAAIAEHLEAVYRRDIKRLLINIPPRSGKSSLISAAFPAWVWLQNPQEKFMYASYASALALEHSLKCRRLIESPWYQARWGDLYQLASDQNAKGFFENTAGGYRIATSVGASATGRGASILVCDDPNNAKDGESEVKRDSTNQWKAQVWSTRLNDPKKDCEIVIQQRIHEQDVSGIILSHDDRGEWVKLILPMEFESSHRAKTIVLPSTEGKVWEDPRMEEGELLSVARFGKQEIDRYKTELGSYGYAGQYQQRPAPEEGGIFKKAWFKWWKNATPPDLQMLVQSWDTAYSEKPTSDYSACTTWGIWEDQNEIVNVILLGLWRGQVGYEELRKRAQRLHFDYRDTGKERNASLKGREVGMCLVEATGFGDQLIKDLKQARITALPFVPKPYGDKTRRAHLVSPLVEGGVVWLPAQAPHFQTLLPFAQDFERYAAIFPKADSRDVIDTMTQALIRLKDGFTLSHPHDIDRTPQETYRPARGY